MAPPRRPERRRDGDGARPHGSSSCGDWWSGETTRWGARRGVAVIGSSDAGAVRAGPGGCAVARAEPRRSSNEQGGEAHEARCKRAQGAAAGAAQCRGRGPAAVRPCSAGVRRAAR